MFKTAFSSAQPQGPSEFFTVNPQQICNANPHITITYSGPIKPQKGFISEREDGAGYTAVSQDFIFEWKWENAHFMSGSGLGPFVVYWLTDGEKTVELTITSTQTPENKIVIRKKVKIATPEVTAKWSHATCTNPKARVKLFGENGVEPYAFSMDGVHFQDDPNFEMVPGRYEIWVRDALGCADTKTIDIFPVQELSINLPADTTICAGASLYLPVVGNATQYVWEPGPGISNINATEQVVRPMETTTYTVTGTLDCKTAAKSVTVRVTPAMTLQLTPDTQVEPNTPVQLTALSPEVSGIANVRYQWNPPTGLDDPQVYNPIATVDRDQFYAVEVSSPEGCSVRGNVRITVRAKSFLILMPDVFTPNGDGLNDTFHPENGSEIRFQDFKIYNRWGEVVFASANNAFVWDGKVGGRDAQEGNYLYRIEGTTFQGRKVTKEGVLLLKR
ncbi:gliding motility-associated C-terminal domain-containing protein [Dyadobacter crusticola]|uniref:gliding motility-associated C-terminal domain-containing protein n=1 Tax=Dyadobacter crusticola TaxID=292407 RepID=UPI00146FAE55|nr:gliding motility-associated C-terminal domain-containing protein [Dyadobacter crusticola]